MITKTTIPSTAGMLTIGDRFALRGAATIWTVEDVSANPLDADQLTFTVTAWMSAGSTFRQVLPLHFDQEVDRHPGDPVPALAAAVRSGRISTEGAIRSLLT